MKDRTSVRCHFKVATLCLPGLFAVGFACSSSEPTTAGSGGSAGQASGGTSEKGGSSGSASAVGSGGAASSATSATTPSETGGAMGGWNSGRSGGAVASGGATTIVRGSGGASATGGSIFSDSSGAGGGSGTGGAPGGGGRMPDGGPVAPDGGGASDALQGTGGTTASGGMAGTGGGGALDFTYWLGMDVSFEETQPEATRENLLSVMKSHGINSVRLRVFVDPTASDGYNKSGACDLAHTIAFGKQIKAAGMGFLVDFHYSDNWADPGKQCVPVKWQSISSIGQLATTVHDYTKDAITQLIAGGARPDMVQVGNETTPGLLIHRCDSGGQPTGDNPVNGKTSNWANTGALLKAGVDGVKEVDSKILTSFHIAKGGDHTDGSSALSTSVTWLTSALKYTPVDAFGLSCYQTYQGDKSSASKSKTIWQTVEGGLASKFPNVKIFAAEYGGAPREINDVIFNLANQQGLGTFYWEPTMAGDWNPGVTIFSRSGSTYTATSNAAVYDTMKTAYASRL